VYEVVIHTININSFKISALSVAFYVRTHHNRDRETIVRSKYTFINPQVN
jgi:hypothetical protein